MIVYSPTPEQLAFVEKLENWSAPCERGMPDGLSHVTGLRLQSGYICLTLNDDDYAEMEYAIAFRHLVAQHGEFIKAFNKEEASEIREETLKELREAIAAIELQLSEEELLEMVEVSKREKGGDAS